MANANDERPIRDVTILGDGPIGRLAALTLARRLPPDMPLRLIAGRRRPAA